MELTIHVDIVRTIMIQLFLEKRQDARLARAVTIEFIFSQYVVVMDATKMSMNCIG